eukprot:CAMPEP_0202707012 /NCGR_PEP_ID=MMETSP1385-20130828/19358_1 /ASSEMBLY_ACC=CAM_ASM_000861 /TAXON_ID=933848 /ORGANISM="Elphidium margaritaceum" /LENGTH=942 /DNA_ID=CAMNT_0049365619 /DNA_START=45 /DNA_END=2873 /DNA_ORIENTATION=+
MEVDSSTANSAEVTSSSKTATDAPVTDDNSNSNNNSHNGNEKQTSENENKNGSRESNNNDNKQAVASSSSPSHLNHNHKIMNNKKKVELREKLKQLALTNRNIVLKGCGNWRCTNPVCKSNIVNQAQTYDDVQASKLALKMIKEKHKTCASFENRSVVPLHYELVAKFVSLDDNDDKTQAQTDADAADHKQLIVDAFLHWDVLYESFTTDKSVCADDIAIDFHALDKTFEALMQKESLCQDVIDALDTSITTYLRTLKSHDENHKITLNELRALIILMDCPLVLSEDLAYHGTLSRMLSIFEEINNVDFRSIKVIHKWLSAYGDLSRLQRMLRSLHQFMTLTISMKEDEIEDASEDWKCELKYDDTDDTDERDEIQHEIDKRQQGEREKYMKQEIAAVIKFIDVIFIANKIITTELESQQQEETDATTADEEESGDNKMEVEQPQTQEPEPEFKSNDENETKEVAAPRLSLVNMDSLQRHSQRVPLNLVLFHNDGLNEVITSKTESRSHIHRRDFLHWRDHDFFTYLAYPYLLTAASKARYLEFENLWSQHRARRRRMVDLMLHGMNILNQFNRHQLIEELDLVLRCRRDSLIQDTLGILQLQEPNDLRKKLRIVFDGEQGIDQGGLTKEYFQLIMKELFDPNYGMFVYHAQTHNYWFNRDCFELADTHTMLVNYELVGKLLGIAIYNNTILDLRFPRVIFKKLLQNEAIHFDDFRDYDPEMATGFEQLLSMTESEGSVEDIYCRNFVIKWENYFGQSKEYDLLHGDGEQTMLTVHNRQRYVDHYIKYTLVESIEQQFNAFLKGFKTVCDSELFAKFSATELELLVCGSQNFDFEALELSTRYEDGFTKESKVVRDFWSVAHELSDSDKRQLLTFCTGSDRVPINGLGELTLTISKNGNDNSKLPTSHTCFNHLLLPEYSSKEIMKTRLLLAIQNSEGFGLL